MAIEWSQQHIEEAVRMEATFLDSAIPDWPKRIHPAALDMRDCHECVLGQLYGSYSEGFWALRRCLVPAYNAPFYGQESDEAWAEFCGDCWRAEVARRIVAPA